MKQVGDGFFENEVQKYVSDTELRTIAGHSSGSFFVPQVGTIMRCGCRISECIFVRYEIDNPSFASCDEAVSVRGRSSVGRAPQWHCGGRQFEPDRLHQVAFFVLMCRSGGIGRHA